MTERRVFYLSSAATAEAVASRPTGPLFEQPEPAPPGGALLYVYRPRLRFGMMQVLGASLDGHDLAAVPNGSWQLAHMTTGAHTLNVADPHRAVRCRPPALTFHAQGGHTYYAECHLHPIDMSVTWNLSYARIGCELALQPADHALRYMVGLRRSEPRTPPACG